jgi:hypothetical protein
MNECMQGMDYFKLVHYGKKGRRYGGILRLAQNEEAGEQLLTHTTVPAHPFGQL